MIYLIETITGRVIQTCICHDEGSTVFDIAGTHTVVSPVEHSVDAVYYSGTELIEFPVKPSPHHEWDWPTKSWLPNLDAAKAAKKTEIETELSRRLYLPCNGFDADKVSRERISGMIARLQRGDGLPASWVGWRDASNQQHWSQDDAATVLANLTALSRAIEDREQALLVASWTHKANIAALTDIDAIIDYDVTANWPV
jgi:hypothetical protein